MQLFKKVIIVSLGIILIASSTSWAALVEGWNGVSGGYNAGHHDFDMIALGTRAAQWAAGTNKSVESVYIGHESGMATSANYNTGDQNTFVGDRTGTTNTSGAENTFLGAGAGIANTTGARNVFTGRASGYNSTTGDDNIYIGYYAGFYSSTGRYNVMIGREAGKGTTSYASSDNNVFLGYMAGYSNNGSDSNVFIGYQAGYANTTESSLVFIGYKAGDSNTTGSLNTFIGYESGQANTTGDNNTFLGYQAGYSNTTSTGSIFLGYQAGYNETSGNKLYIDNTNTSTPLIYGDFSTNVVGVFGQLGVGGANATANIGSYELYVDGQFYASGSSREYKKNIEELPSVLSQLKKLNPVKYDYKKEYRHFGKKLVSNYQIGLIAQDVEKVFPELAVLHNGEVKNVDYEKLSVILLKGFQELTKDQEALKAQLEVVLNKVKMLESKNNVYK